MSARGRKGVRRVFVQPSVSTKKITERDRMSAGEMRGAGEMSETDSAEGVKKKKKRQMEL